MKSRLISLKHKNKRALLYPEQGFQLYSFEQDFGKRGVASIIYSPKTLTEPEDRRYGNPILFPSPSRCYSKYGATTWVWKERCFTMPPHGFARDLYWHILEVKSNLVTAELSSTGTTKLLFPFDFQLQVTYELNDRGLVLDAKLKNNGEEAFPYALGFHPYLRTPLGRKGSPADCSINLPSGIQVRSEDNWKSYEKKTSIARRIPANADLNATLMLAETKARFLELEDQVNRLIAKVSVEGSKEDFPIWAIWNPSPEAPYICLEPWTDMPNALNRAGTRTCPPNQTHHYQMVLSVRPFA